MVRDAADRVGNSRYVGDDIGLPDPMVDRPRCRRARMVRRLRARLASIFRGPLGAIRFAAARTGADRAKIHYRRRGTHAAKVNQARRRTAKGRARTVGIGDSEVVRLRPAARGSVKAAACSALGPGRSRGDISMRRHVLDPCDEPYAGRLRQRGYLWPPEDLGASMPVLAQLTGTPSS